MRDEIRDDGWGENEMRCEIRHAKDLDTWGNSSFHGYLTQRGGKSLAKTGCPQNVTLRGQCIA